MTDERYYLTPIDTTLSQGYNKCYAKDRIDYGSGSGRSYGRKRKR